MFTKLSLYIHFSIIFIFVVSILCFLFIMNSKEICIIAPECCSFERINTKNCITDVIKHKQGNPVFNFLQLTQIYNGPIVNGCYHGLGLIIWIEDNKKRTYEGYFYLNRIHGYGRMVYENGLIFEGLYKDNMHFGPGIMTHPNQCQEVGFWVGNHILRLSLNLTTNTVPAFNVQDNTNKIKLLQFRDLIDITQMPHSIINVQDNNEKYLNNRYSYLHTRHLNSLYFDVQTYDPDFISKSLELNNSIKMVNENRFICGYNLNDLVLKNYIKIPQKTSQSKMKFLLNSGIRIGNQFDRFNTDSWTIQIEHCDDAKTTNSKIEYKNEKSDDILFTTFISSKVLAYNNSTLDKMILAHAYQQRFGEKTLLYNVDNIWSGKRSTFMSPHSQELAAVKMLNTLDLTPSNFHNFVQNNDVDLDVADSKGNTRLMISSANDQHEIVKCIINLGANLECYNDDGFTPLNLALMRYISLLNDIKSWTEYLLPDIHITLDIKKGNQNIFLENVQKTNFFQPENLPNMKFIEHYDEIEDTSSTLKYLPLKTKKTKLNVIEDTILLLINMGASVSTCFTPKRTIHLALLSINPTVLNAVFNAGGSPLYILSNKEYKLNLLHMAVMMHINYNVVKCVEVLITHHVDPNSKAIPMLSLFQYELPWKNITTDEASMTPLDILCLKKNNFEFDEKLSEDEQLECELASMLYSVTMKSHTYCGFKPIALAMLTGKLNLTKIFLEKNWSILNENISGFGTLLSLILNPNYNLNLSNQKICALLALLLKAKANTLKIFENFNEEFKGNIYEYCFMLNKSKKLNQNENLSNFTEIVKKLENAGRTFLNSIYIKKAIDALLKQKSFVSNNTYDNTAMLLWMDFWSDLEQQVKSGINLHNQTSSFETTENNKFNAEKNMKNKAYLLYFEQIKNVKTLPINLTEEECQVCYECLKHFSKDMEYCSSCYFALLCSENCKNQHNNYTCILQMRKNHLVKVENKFKKYNLKIQNSSSKSYLLSAYLFSSDKSIELEGMKNVSSKFLSSKKLSLEMQSQSSSFSKKLNNLDSDYTNDYFPPTHVKLVIGDDTNKYKEYNKFEDGFQSKENNGSLQIPNINTAANISSSTTYKNRLADKSKSVGKPIKNKSVDKLIKNKSVDKLNISTGFLMKRQHTFVQNNSSMRKKTSQNQERTLIIKNQSKDPRIVSIKKYKTMRTAGCPRPIFMFINRDSNESVTTFKNKKTLDHVLSNINTNQ